MNLQTQNPLSETCAVPADLAESFSHLLDAKIMMVDDEPITMEVVQAFLEDAGYKNFMLVDEPARAMQYIEKMRPDLLLLDLMMPDISGFDILKSLRNRSKFNHLPVLILSSSSDNTDKLQALDLGATDFLSKPVDPSELILRVRNTLAAKAYMDQLAFYDPLTKLPNRHLFFEHLERALASAVRSREILALLSIELDRFDKISGNLGVTAGNDVLCALTQQIGAVIRREDVLSNFIFDDDTTTNFFHFEGGVFKLIVQKLTCERDAALVAKRLLNAIGQPLQVNGTELYVTASIGISVYPTEQADSGKMLQLASGARGYAKDKGGNTFQFSSRQINIEYQQRLNLEARLHKALERNELLLYYQPKVSVQTNTIVGVEALLRWRLKDRGLIPPDNFIPVAEETGIIIPIGQWVLSEACRQLIAWRKAGKAPLNMAVNLSPAQFGDPDLIRVFRKTITESGIDPRRLTFEVTENMLLEDIDSKIEILDRLKEMGVKLSIDDFGTGYSSLSYLRRLPLDELKIDRSFFVDIFEDPKSRAMLDSMIHLAHNFGLRIVAEGVETEKQLHLLQAGVCDQYQGYFFSPPVPPGELEQMLAPAR